MGDVTMPDFTTDPFDLSGPLFKTWKAATIDVPTMLAAKSCRFMGRRYLAQADFLNAIAQCSSVEDVFSAQSRLASEAVADFNDEARLMVDEAEALVTPAVG